MDSGAAQVKQRDCRTCRAGRAGQGGPWSLADALQKRRRTVTGKLEQPELRAENTEHRQDEWWMVVGQAGPATPPLPSSDINTSSPSSLPSDQPITLSFSLTNLTIKYRLSLI